MKTLIFLNEGTQIIAGMSFDDFEKLIEENHDKSDNFVLLPCEVKIFFSKDCFPIKDIKSSGGRFKLYIKRILFFQEHK